MSIRPAAALESQEADAQDTKPRPKSSPLRRRKRSGLDSKASTAIKEGLTWLVEHQQKDGSWDCDGFSDRCPKDRCTGHGEAVHDVGVTGLAALALMTFAEPQGTEPVDAALARALDWLSSAQHKTSGLIGARLGHAFHYDHAVATRALALAQRRWPELELGDTVQLAVRYIESARNVGAAWRYEMPPNGDNDSSITAWMCAALIDAERAGSAVDRSAFPEILAWLDSVTQADSSRVGYTSPNGESARVPTMNDHYGSGGSETLTAAALATRLRLGEELSPERLLTEELSIVLAASPRIQTRKPALEWGRLLLLVPRLRVAPVVALQRYAQASQLVQGASAFAGQAARGKGPRGRIVVTHWPLVLRRWTGLLDVLGDPRAGGANPGLVPDQAMVDLRP